MTNLTLRDLYKKLDAGDISDLEVVHKFGRNPVVPTTFTPIAIGGFYRTPQVAGATALRVKAGDANDTAAGSGARQVSVQGLDETGALVSEQLATNGASAGTAGTTTFIRVFRAWVNQSGTYATQTAGSHAADIVIENSAGTEDWLTIDATDFPRSQSEIAVYSVPLGYKAYIGSIAIAVDSNKTAEVLLFKREGILDTAAPYQAMREQLDVGGVTGEVTIMPMTLIGPYPELTDVGFMAKVPTGTGEVDIDFEIVLTKGDG